MDNEHLEGNGSIKMSSKQIQHFLKQLWTVVSDPRNHSIAIWTEGGHRFKVIDREVFYHELCPKFCDGCDEKFFDYFMTKCGFNVPPPHKNVFYHQDFLEHEFARIKNIQPKQTLYTPFAYYSYVLETPNHQVPFISEESRPLGNVEVTASGTLKKRESVGSKAASVGDTVNEIETVLALFLRCSDYLHSEDHSLDSGSSTYNTLVETPPDSAISCSTPESLLSTVPSKVIVTKNDYEKDLTSNLNECRLEEHATESSSSTLTSGSNSPNLSASPTADFKDSSESLDSSASTDNIKIKDSKSTFKLDLDSSVSNEECADPNSESIPRISASNNKEARASDERKL